MSLKECPSCGADSIFLPLIPAAGYDGRLYGSRSKGFCNNSSCDQRLWYHPRTGRVTRRTVGIALEEYTQQKLTSATNLTVINRMRRRVGLPLLMDVGEPERAARALHALIHGSEEAPPPEPKNLAGTRKRTLPFITSVVTRPWYTRLPDTIVNWFWYIVAAFKSPFIREDSDCHGE